MSMTPAHAWRFVADRAQTTIANDDEQLVLCDALSELAEDLHLTDEVRATRSLRAAVVARMNAQLEFRGFLNPEARRS
jgi:hypothetical protein